MMSMVGAHGRRPIPRRRLSWLTGGATGAAGYLTRLVIADAYLNTRSAAFVSPDLAHCVVSQSSAFGELRE